MNMKLETFPKDEHTAEEVHVNAYNTFLIKHETLHYVFHSHLK